MSEAGLCFVCGRTAASKCGRCHVVRYCGEACQRTNWPSHRAACRDLLSAALIQVEDLVFDVSSQPPRALIRPRAPGAPSASGAPVSLTSAQLAAPLGQWPFGRQGGGTPPQPVIGSFRLGTSVELPIASSVGKSSYEEYVRDAPKLGGGGRLSLAAATGVSDTMFSITVVVETWTKSGGALWLVSDVVDVVLEHYRKKHAPDAPGLVWGSRNVKGMWAVSLEEADRDDAGVRMPPAPGQFALLPHLYYHFTHDVTGSSSNSCCVV